MDDAEEEGDYFIFIFINLLSISRTHSGAHFFFIIVWVSEVSPISPPFSIKFADNEDCSAHYFLQKTRE